MPLSMTAFATTTVQLDWGVLTWELRSVNHRFLEPHLRLPETLKALEIPLREQLKQFVQRGKIDCVLSVEASRQRCLATNLELARQYIDAGQAVAQLMANPAPLSPLEILRWPGVLQEPDGDRDQLRQAVVELFDKALQQLVECRTREGIKLGETLQRRVDDISAQVAIVRRALPDLLTAQRHKLQTRLAELRGEVDHSRLEQELVYLAQRSDVAEELDRLDTHLIEIRRILGSQGPQGRRLDFLLQELNREANTLAAKSLGVATTQPAVEIKVLIEQMREQIQNLE